MKYWESAKFMELLAVWDKQQHRESAYHQQLLRHSPSKYSYLLSDDEDEQHDLGTHLELAVKCPECGAEHTYYLDAVTHKVYNIPAYYKECQECGENVHLMSNLIRQIEKENIHELKKSSDVPCVTTTQKADKNIAKYEPKDEDYQVGVYPDHISVYNEKTGLHIKFKDLSPRKVEDESEYIKKILTTENTHTSKTKSEYTRNRKYEKKDNDFYFYSTIVLFLVFSLLAGGMLDHNGHENSASLFYSIGMSGFSLLVLYAIGLFLLNLFHGLTKRVQTVYNNAKNWQLHHWAISSCCILLLITIIGGDRPFLWKAYSLPNGYYTLLRLAVTATAAYLGYIAAKNKAHPLVILASAATAILFQPLAPISFEHGTWLWIDLATAPLLLLCALHCSKAGKPEKEQT